MKGLPLPVPNSLFDNAHLTYFSMHPHSFGGLNYARSIFPGLMRFSRDIGPVPRSPPPPPPIFSSPYRFLSGFFLCNPWPCIRGHFPKVDFPSRNSFSILRWLRDRSYGRYVIIFFSLGTRACSQVQFRWITIRSTPTPTHFPSTFCFFSRRYHFWGGRFVFLIPSFRSVLRLLPVVGYTPILSTPSLPFPLHL